MVVSNTERTHSLQRTLFLHLIPTSSAGEKFRTLYHICPLFITVFLGNWCEVTREEPLRKFFHNIFPYLLFVFDNLKN